MGMEMFRHIARRGRGCYRGSRIRGRRHRRIIVTIKVYLQGSRIVWIIRIRSTVSHKVPAEDTGRGLLIERHGSMLGLICRNDPSRGRGRQPRPFGHCVPIPGRLCGSTRLVLHTEA